KAVHGEQALRLYKPLPLSGTVIGKTRVIDIVDKGQNALIYVERTIRDCLNGEVLATLLQTIVCRGDGGFGGSSRGMQLLTAPPEHVPDRTLEIATHTQMALIYRLSGDLNPL